MRHHDSQHDAQLGFDIQALHSDALRQRRQWRDPNAEWEAADDAQEAILRYLEGGGLEQIVHSKGTAEAWIHGILRHVQLERSRDSARHRWVAIALIDIPEVASQPDASDSEAWERVLVIWWQCITHRRRIAVVRTHGALFGRVPDHLPSAADRKSSSQAVAQLRQLAIEAGLYSPA